MVVAEPAAVLVPVRYTPLLLMSGYLQKRYMEDYSGTPAVLVARGVVFLPTIRSVRTGTAAPDCF